MKSKFKIGDKVKIKKVDSADSELLNNQLGTIIEIKSCARSDLGRGLPYYLLDIEVDRFGDKATGIWEYELELFPKEIKIYGIVKFFNELEKVK